MKARVPSSSRHAAAPKIKLPADLDIDFMLSNARQASEFLKALSHEVRLLILCFLIEGERSVSEIEKMLKNDFKLEVESLISKDISYVTEEYVPARLKEQDWLD